VLRWVKDGCPEGVWPDFTYKTTAAALAGRGLLTVRRRRERWSAELTPAGESYLRHGHHLTGDATTSEPRALETHTDAEHLAASILAELTSGAGTLTVPDPTDRDRARYRRALHRLATGRQTPTASCCGTPGATAAT